MIHTQPVDISKSVARYIKFTLVTVLIIAATIGAAVFYSQHIEDTLTVRNAKISGTLVSIRVLTDGKVKQLTRADGDNVDAGDVVANLEVAVTEEQLAQLENAVKLAQENYETLQQGQMVKVAVQKAVPKTVVKPQATQRVYTPAPAADLSALEERKNRMEKLYEMGAISRVQRDAAVAEYEAARYESSAPTVEEYTPEPIVETEIEYVTEYVEQFQPTPPEILEGAQLAIKQAEMSLNTARQEALQTQVSAPISGTIYYDVQPDRDVVAGEPIAKVGDGSNLWLEAEVTEDQFYRIALGKLVSYSIDGHQFDGTVIEKIAPNAYTGVGGPYPMLLAENDQPTEPSDTQDFTQAVDAPFDTSALDESSLYEPEPIQKFIVKFSLPSDRAFEYRPNVSTDVTVHDPLISWRWIKPLYREALEKIRSLRR